MIHGRSVRVVSEKSQKVSKHGQKNLIFPRAITFWVKKFGYSHLCKGASHIWFYTMNPKSQIWDCSFWEKSKRLKDGHKIENLAFLRAITFCVKFWTWQLMQGSFLLSPFCPFNPKNIIWEKNFRENVQKSKNLDQKLPSHTFLKAVESGVR